MVLLSERILTSMFGMVEETYHISKKAKFPRKMYMGVWSLRTQLTAQTIAPFPSKVRR